MLTRKRKQLDYLWVLVPLVLAMQVTEAAATSPPNPDRPVTARTCREAILVLREAVAGNPLASVPQNAARVAAAVELVDRLCVDATNDGNR